MHGKNQEQAVGPGQVENTPVSKKQAPRVPRLLTGYLFLLMSLYAASMTMLGPIIPSVIADYKISLSQGGLMMTAQSVGGILAILFVAITADRFKKPRLIFLAYLTFALALTLAGFINIYLLLLLVFFFYGIGSRISDTIMNAYFSDLYQQRRGYYLNLLHTFFGIGALFGPIYARYILDSEIPWSLVFSLLGLTCAVMILLMPLVMRFASKNQGNITKADSSAGAIDKTQNEAKHKPLNIIAFVRSSPVIILICLVMILYLAHQASLSTWIPMYLETELNASPTMASVALSILWLGIILGRVASAQMTGKVSAFRIMIGGGLIGAVTITAGIVLQRPLLLIVAMGLTGLFTGATIPLLVTIACDRYPENSATASSMIFLSGSMATMVFPWLVGRLAELFTFQHAMKVTWISLYLMTGVLIWMRRLYYRAD